MPKGDCFRMALVVALQLRQEGQDAKVCHGLPIGQGPLNNGKRYWHAWVETNTGKQEVLDYSANMRLRMRRAEYYRHGQIDGDAHVWRFTLDECRRLVTLTGHTGPWVPDPEGMEVVHG